MSVESLGLPFERLDVTTSHDLRRMNNTSHNNDSHETDVTEKQRVPASESKWRNVLNAMSLGIMFSPALPESIEGLIARFRRRARRLAIFSSFAVVGAVVVLLGGIYFFLYQSSEIAVRDLEQRTKVERESRDQVKMLSGNYITIRRLRERIGENTAKNKRLRLAATKLKEKFQTDKADWSGNQRSHWRTHAATSDELLRYLDTENAYENETRFVAQEITTLENMVRRTRVKIEELEGRLHSQQRLNREVASEETKRLIKTLDASLSSTRSRLASAQNLINDPSLIQKRIDNQKADIVRRKEKLRTVIQKYEEESAAISENLEKSDAEKDALNDELDRVQAASDLLVTSGGQVKDTVRKNNDVIFAVTANLTRIGAIIVVIFFAQMFMAIYRYSMRLSGYYNARADAIELVSKHEIVEGSARAEMIIKFVPVLSPEGVDFSRPKTPVEDLAKLAAVMKDLRG